MQVNIAGEESKQGVAPQELRRISSPAAAFAVSGLMTMPPLTDQIRRARDRTLRSSTQLADEHGLTELSMGTSQDFAVAVEEGATLIRVGSVLFT